MLPSWRLARNTLAGRFGRSVLLSGAVAAAAALVAAVSCSTTSVQATMEQVLTSVLGAADARIIHVGNAEFDDSWLQHARQWPEVTAVNGHLNGSLVFMRMDPEAGRLRQVQVQARGVDFDTFETFGGVDLLEGRLPDTADEIIIDPLTRRELGADVGTVLRIQQQGPPIKVTVVGVYDRAQFFFLQKPQIIADRSVIAEALGKQGQLSRIVMKLEPGADVQAFCERHKGELPALVSLEPAEMARSGFDRRVQASRFGLIVSTIMTFMSASFIIVTGLTTSVTEKQREMAIVRAIGGSRGQLFAAQLMVGAFFAAVGAGIGIPAGVGFSAALVAWFDELLPAGFHISVFGLWFALAGAFVAGLLGALYPAMMASRTTPLQAMTRQARPQRATSIIICLAIAAAFIGLQLGLMIPGDREARFWGYFYVGLPSLFLGYFLLAIPLLLVVTATIGRGLCALLRLPRDVVIGSITRTRFRHGFTAGALMVGMAILVSNWSSTQALLDGWVAKIEFADGFAYRAGGIPQQQQQAIRDLHFVEATCAIGYLPVRVIGQQVFGIEGIDSPNVIAFGFEPETFFKLNAVTWSQGDPETAIRRLKEGDALLVADRFEVARGIGVGDEITLGMGDVEHTYEVVGVISSAGLDLVTQMFGIRSQYAEYAVSGVFMDFNTVEADFGNRDTPVLQIELAEDISDERATELISEAAPGAAFYSGRWILDTINTLALAIYSVQSTIAFAALLLACIGMGNVIAASIHGRRYEYGLLRAMGAHKYVLRRLILSEVAILAVTGALTGTVLGLHMASVGVIFYRDLAGISLSLIVPYLPTLIGWAVTIALASLAAVPAVRKLVRSTPGSLLAAGRND